MPVSTSPTVTPAPFPATSQRRSTPVAARTRSPVARKTRSGWQARTPCSRPGSRRRCGLSLTTRPRMRGRRRITTSSEARPRTAAVRSVVSPLVRSHPSRLRRRMAKGFRPAASSQKGQGRPGLPPGPRAMAGSAARQKPLLGWVPLAMIRHFMQVGTSTGYHRYSLQLISDHTSSHGAPAEAPAGRRVRPTGAGPVAPGESGQPGQGRPRGAAGRRDRGPGKRDGGGSVSNTGAPVAEATREGAAGGASARGQRAVRREGALEET